MNSSHEIHNILENIFGNVKGLHSSDQVQIDCPKCMENDGLSHGDGKYNLEINTNIKKFRCWRCDDPPFQGRLSKLIKRYGSPSDFELYKVYAGNEDEYDTINIDDEEDIVVVLPEEFISFTKINLDIRKHYEAYSYLVLDRKYDIKLINDHNIGFCCAGKYKDRIIVPSYDRYNDLNYFISRLYVKDSWRPKYDNPQANKKKIIFNESRIKWDSTVYLVEGAFDMLSIPINTIPLLGKTLSGALLDKLRRFKPNIVILLDPDAIKNAKAILIELVSLYGNDEKHKVKIVELPNNDDIDEIRKYFGKDVMLNHVRNARNINIDDYFKK